MKNKLLSHASLLITFVGEIENLATNPYSTGIDITRLLSDLKGYGNQMVELIKELPDDETEEPEIAE
jgi:hypothetical protein